jgi:hypothetical protein
MSDDILKPLRVRQGPSQGDSIELRMVEKIGGPETIRKTYRTNADGSTTRAHTRGQGTFPEIITEKRAEIDPEVTASDSRTFVFNTYGSWLGVVSNYHVTIKNNLIVGQSGYNVSPRRTKVNSIKSSKWNDVWRIDKDWATGETTFKINGFDSFYSGVSGSSIKLTSLPDFGPSAIPFFVLQDGKYEAALSEDATRSPLFVGSNNGTSYVASLTPSGAEKERQYAGGVTDLAGLCGMRVTDTGRFHFGSAAFYYGSSDFDTLAGVDTYWSAIDVSAQSPFINTHGYGVSEIMLGTLPEFSAVPARFAGTFSAGIESVPLLRRGRTQVVVQTPESSGISILQLGADWGNTLFSTGRTPDLETIEMTCGVDDRIEGTITSGGGVSLKTSFEVNGSYKNSEVPNGEIYAFSDYTGQGLVHFYFLTPLGYTQSLVYDGSRRDTTSTAKTKLRMKALSALPESTILLVDTVTTASVSVRDEREAYDYETGVYGTAREDFSEPGYYYEFFHPTIPTPFYPIEFRAWANAPFCNGSQPSCITSFPTYTLSNAHSIIDPKQVSNTETYEMNIKYLSRVYTIANTSTVMSVETIDYIYADIDEEVFVYLKTTLSYKLSTANGSTSESASLTAQVILNSRFGSTSVSVPVPAIQFCAIDLLGRFVAGDVSEYHLTDTVGHYHRNYAPVQVFSPVFMEQGNCPWVSYTTKAEEVIGTAPEIHVDFTVRAEKYSTVAGYVGMRYTGTVAFVPHQFLHIHQRYIKHTRGLTDYNFGLWAAMFSNPIRLQFSNVGGNPQEFSSDIKLQNSRI